MDISQLNENLPVSPEIKGEQNRLIITDAITRGTANTMAYGTAEFVDAARWFKENDPNTWEFEFRPEIKRTKSPQVSMSHIDKATTPPQEEEKTLDLIDYIRSKCELIYNEASGDEFVTVITSKGEETMAVDSEQFSKWVAYEVFLVQNGIPINDNQKNQIISTISSLCQFEGTHEQVFLRAGYKDQTYYLNMADDEGRVIEISEEKWQIRHTSPIKFWKPSNSLSFAEPIRGGSIELLWNHCNIPEQYRPLVVATILESWRCNTSTPLLELYGIQGSAKSHTQKRLRDLMDPNRGPLRSKPKTVEDIFVAARNNRVISYENLSHLSPEEQDAFCCVVTGGSYATRLLFSNKEESVIEVQRPILLNGIPGVVRANDLLDRAISIELPRLTVRKTDTDLNDEFNKDLPYIFGGLLDLFVLTLQKLPELVKHKPSDLPRMADFALLGEAMYAALGKRSGEFIRLYNENRKGAIERSIDSSPIITALMRMVSESSKEVVFEGTKLELLDRLTADYKESADKWPASSKGFDDLLKRHIPALESMGVLVEDLPRSAKGSRVRIAQQPKTQSVLDVDGNEHLKLRPNDPEPLIAEKSAVQSRWGNVGAIVDRW